MDMSLSKLQEIVEEGQSMGSQRVRHSRVTEQQQRSSPKPLAREAEVLTTKEVPQSMHLK